MFLITTTFYLIDFGITDKRRVPRFYLDTKEIEDYQKLASTLPAFVSLGAKIPLWWLHEKTGIPVASDGEETLQQTMQIGTGALKFAALKANAGEETPLDAKIPQLLLDRTHDDLMPATGAWIEQIRALSEQVNSLEELEDRLLEIYPSLSLDDYASALTDANVAAHLSGRDRVRK